MDKFSFFKPSEQDGIRPAVFYKLCDPDSVQKARNENAMLNFLRVYETELHMRARRTPNPVTSDQNTSATRLISALKEQGIEPHLIQAYTATPDEFSCALKFTLTADEHGVLKPMAFNEATDARVFGVEFIFGTTAGILAAESKDTSGEQMFVDDTDGPSEFFGIDISDPLLSCLPDLCTAMGLRKLPNDVSFDLDEGSSYYVSPKGEYYLVTIQSDEIVGIKDDVETVV